MVVFFANSNHSFDISGVLFPIRVYLMDKKKQYRNITNFIERIVTSLHWYTGSYVLIQKQKYHVLEK